MNAEIYELIAYRMQQARDGLNAARTLKGEALYRDSINRAYYSSFYCVLALLASKGLGTAKHSGAIALFDKEFVRTSIFSPELSAILHGGFDMRQEADYQEMTVFEESDAESAINGAEQFLVAVQGYFSRAAGQQIDSAGR